MAVLGLLALADTSSCARAGLSDERWRAVHVVCAVLVLAGSFVHVTGVGAYLFLPAIRWAVLLLVVTAAVAVFCIRVARPYATALRLPRRARVRERGGRPHRRARGRGLRVRGTPGSFRL